MQDSLFQFGPFPVCAKHGDAKAIGCALMLSRHCCLRSNVPGECCNKCQETGHRRHIEIRPGFSGCSRCCNNRRDGIKALLNQFLTQQVVPLKIGCPFELRENREMRHCSLTGARDSGASSTSISHPTNGSGCLPKAPFRYAVQKSRDAPIVSSALLLKLFPKDGPA